MSSDQQIQVVSTKSDDGFMPSLHTDRSSLDSEDYEDFTDPSSWASLRLPQYILLKGDNDKYLRTVTDRSNEFTADNKMDNTIFEVVTSSDGAVGIRSSFNNLFLWTSDRILAASSVIGSEYNARSWPVKMGRGTHANLVGLRQFQTRISQYRCARSVHQRLVSVFGVVSSKSTCFEVEEAVSQRQIYGVQYHMENAKIYDHEPLTSVTKDVKNWSARPQKGVLSFSHTESESQTWGSTGSWKISGSVGISVRIPFVKETSITTEAYYSGAYEWGEAKEIAKEIASQLEVEIPL